MPFGLRTILKKLIIIKDLTRFFILKNLLGFDNATKILYSCIKESVIPILKSNGATIGKDCDIETLNDKSLSSFFSEGIKEISFDLFLILLGIVGFFLENSNAESTALLANTRHSKSELLASLFAP